MLLGWGYALMFKVKSPRMGWCVHLQKNSIFDLDLGTKVTRNVAQYPQHRVNYSATKFEVATSCRLGGDALTIKYII